MADVKISQLPPASTPLTGTEIFPLVQNGTTVNSSLNNISSAVISNTNSFTGFNGQTGSVGVLGTSAGSDWVGFLPAGATAVPRTEQSKLRESVSVLDFGAKGDGVTDDTAAIQAAADYCFANRCELYVPNPSVAYLLTSTIYIVNHSFVGDAPFGGTQTGQFLCRTNITAFNIAGSRIRIENIGVKFTIPGGAGSGAVGINFGNPVTTVNQFSISMCRNLWVSDAYRSFTVASSGPAAIWGCSFEHCFSLRHIDWGFYFFGTPTAGSTTLYFNECMAFGSSAAAEPKGFYFQNMGEIICGIIDCDAIKNQGIYISTIGGFTADLVRFESCSLTTNNSFLVRCVVSPMTINNLEVQNLTVDVGVGNSASLIWHAASFSYTHLANIRSLYGTTTSGTLYKIKGSAKPHYLSIWDKDLTLADCDTLGYQAAYYINGQFKASFAQITSIGESWVAGDFVYNVAPAELGAASSKYTILGWTRATTGSGNVLNTDWFQSRTLTGN